MDAPTRARNRVWIIIGISAGICVFVFLIGIQPSYFAYVLAGVLCGIAIRWWVGLLLPWRGKASLSDALLTMLGMVLVLVSATLLGTIIGAYKVLAIVTVVMVILGLLGFRRKLKTIKYLRTLGWLFIPISLITFFIFPAFFLMKAGAPRSVKVQYLGQGTIKEGHWILTHILVIDTESVEQRFRALPEQDASATLVQTMEGCGWKEQLEGTFSLVSDQPVSSKWFPFKTVNTLTFPPMRCSDMIFSTLPDSTLTLTVPEYEIAKTDPEPTNRSEGLEGGEEKIVVPVRFYWNALPTVQVQTISPLLQSRAGNLVLKGDFWTALST